jgi:selenocysteine lyase/cysteine desulfurase
MVDYFSIVYDHHFPNENKSLRVISHVVHDLFRAHEEHLLTPLLEFVSQTNKARLLGPADPARRAPTIALDVGARAQEIAQKLAQRGIMAGASDFYAVRPLKALGVPEATDVLRLSFVHYTRSDEIAALIAALDDVL